MFFMNNLTHTLTLPPSSFGPHIRRDLTQILTSTLEGTCSGPNGYIIAILNPTRIDISKGLIQPGTGLAVFECKYQALVFKPFKGEVVDGVVSTVSMMGFFADVGPLSVFVSKHLIPSEMHFEAAGVGGGGGRYESGDLGVIEKGAKVRMKIVGLRVENTQIFAIGTIKEDYLGAL
ncbi:DNA-directed RNA polymerase II subunit [Saitoella coloradoensis]|nr:DNA-directed RNA polymerase II subunit RPB7 [Saitoella complicata NRRL Y-17804]ODQ52255.1 DNA-directed RNA polymerase II subunit RPB7 [Saitoella complicata NRRL Y-17804]